MISGATEIIAGAPGRCLDPFLLVQSQQTGFHGVVTMAYAGEKPTFDLLFASSDQIRESAHLTEAFRILTTIRAVRERYLRFRTDAGTRIYLHEMPSDSAQRFLATFRYQPSVRLKLGTLTMKQLLSVLVATQCRNGLLEFVSFEPPLPDIELMEINSVDQFAMLDMRGKKGELLLYDITTNQERLQKSIGMGPPAGSTREPGGVSQSEPNQFRRQVRVQMPRTQKDVELPLTHSPQGQRTVSQPQSTPAPLPPVVDAAEDPLPGTGPTPFASANHPLRDEHTNSDRSELAQHFDRILRAFRHRAAEILGGKTGQLLECAEADVRQTYPDFQMQRLDPATALLVLDLMDAAIRAAPILKRGRLRSAVQELVSDLYSKDYDALERSGVLARIEDYYYRLRT